jgi:hypothetical protein
MPLRMHVTWVLAHSRYALLPQNCAAKSSQSHSCVQCRSQDTTKSCETRAPATCSPTVHTTPVSTGKSQSMHVPCCSRPSSVYLRMCWKLHWVKSAWLRVKSEKGTGKNTLSQQASTHCKPPTAQVSASWCLQAPTRVLQKVRSPCCMHTQLQWTRPTTHPTLSGLLLARHVRATSAAQGTCCSSQCSGPNPRESWSGMCSVQVLGVCCTLHCIPDSMPTSHTPLHQGACCPVVRNSGLAAASTGCRCQHSILCYAWCTAPPIFRYAKHHKTPEWGPQHCCH